MYDLTNYNNFDNIILKNRKSSLKEILELNNITQNRGLILTEKQAIELIDNRDNTLKQLGRIELGTGIIADIIYEFYDSSYIDKDNYLELLLELTEVFYLYQQEFDNKLTDERIIKYMKKEFEELAGGSIKLLETTCFDNLRDKILNGDYYD